MDFEIQKKYFLSHLNDDNFQDNFWINLQHLNEYLLDNLNSENLLYLNQFLAKWGLETEALPKNLNCLFKSNFIEEITNNNYSGINLNLIASYLTLEDIKKVYPLYSQHLDLNKIYQYHLDWSEEYCYLEKEKSNFTSIKNYYFAFKKFTPIYSQKMIFSLIDWGANESEEIIQIFEDLFNNGYDFKFEVDGFNPLFRSVYSNKLQYAEYFCEKFKADKKYINQINSKGENLLFYLFNHNLKWALTKPLDFNQVNHNNTWAMENFLNIDLLSGSPISLSLFSDILQKVLQTPIQNPEKYLKVINDFVNFAGNPSYKMAYETFILKNQLGQLNGKTKINLL